MRVLAARSEFVWGEAICWDCWPTAPPAYRSLTTLRTAAVAASQEVGCRVQVFRKSPYRALRRPEMSPQVNSPRDASGYHALEVDAGTVGTANLRNTEPSEQASPFSVER